MLISLKLKDSGKMSKITFQDKSNVSMTVSFCIKKPTW